MTLLAFFRIRMVAGDPIETMAGGRGIDPAHESQLLKEFGLERPVMVQYRIDIGRVLKGDLGKLLITLKPALSEFLTPFPTTIELAVGTARSKVKCNTPIESSIRRERVARTPVPTN